MRGPGSLLVIGRQQREDGVGLKEVTADGRGQDLGGRFTLQHFERLANHWGALAPHPSNYTRDGVLASVRGPTDGIVEWVPFAQRRAASIDAAFPGQLRALPHESPAVLIASNEQEADRISEGLDVGKGYMCTDTAQLASTFEKIFQASVAAT